MEWFKQQVSLYPTEVGLTIGIGIILLGATILAGIQKFNEWRNGE